MTTTITAKPCTACNKVAKLEAMVNGCWVCDDCYELALVGKGMISEEEGMERYNEMLDLSYPVIKIAGSTFYPSTVLKKCDPIGYRVGFSDYADHLAEGGNPVEGYV
jgi:hypothetical protein